MTKALNTYSGTELKQMLRDGVATNVAIMEAVLARIQEVEDQVGAFLTVRPEAELLAEAAAVDQRRKNGEEIGALDGLPVAIKDNLCTKGVATTCASKMLDGYHPPYDATVIAKIKAADGIILGKTNLDEFSMGSSTENSAFKPTRNPHNLAYVPGGTSGGSAAAVAADETIFAIGSDTGGSIRQPASFCGVFGLKPSYGKVSRYGLVAYGSSLDQVGTLTKTAEDARLLLDVIAGQDKMDATSQLGEGKQSTKKVLKIGLPKEYFIEGVSAEVKACAEEFKAKLTALGHELVEVTLPHTKYAIPTYYVIAPAEMSANLERYDGCFYGHRSAATTNLASMLLHSRTEGLGPEVKRRILLGTYVLSAGHYDAYYDKAQRVRTLIRRDFEEAFAQCDVLMSPVAPTPPFKLGEKSNDPISMYLTDIFSVTANLSGLPAVSVPNGVSAEGLPLSMQFTGPMFSETLLLDLAGSLSAGALKPALGKELATQ